MKMNQKIQFSNGKTFDFLLGHRGASAVQNKHRRR